MPGEQSDVRALIQVAAAALGSDASAAMAKANSADAKAAAATNKAAAAEAMASASRILLGDANIVFTGLVNLQVGIRAVQLNVATAQVGDRITARPTEAWPAGYAITDYVFVPEAGKVDLRMIIPVVSIATNVTLPVRLTAVRSA